MSAASLQALRVAVVGLGSIGRRHLENLNRLGVAARVAVRRPRGANAAFEPPAGVAVAHSLQEALGDPLDAAIICNPTSLHVATALEYLEAGVPVLIEKPIAHRLDDAERLIVAARRSGACAGMAYAMRYHPAYRLARDAIAEGRIGRMLYAKVWFEAYLPDWHPWEDYRQGYAARRDLGGGALPTLDHELDFLNWCLGQAERAEGRSGRSGALDMDADDWATLSMRYPSGVTAGGTFSLCRRDRSRGFEFVGERGTLQFDFESGRLELARGGEHGAELLWNGAAYDLNDIYLEMLRDFLGAVVDRRRQAPVPLEAGLHALRVAGAATGGG